jgi:hypothetical protein
MWSSPVFSDLWVFFEQQQKDVLVYVMGIVEIC